LGDSGAKGRQEEGEEAYEQPSRRDPTCPAGIKTTECEDERRA
jgi:hypothetical protein